MSIKPLPTNRHPHTKHGTGRVLEIARSAAQSINNNAFTTVTFDGDLFDPEGLFDLGGTPAEWTVPPGLYVILARLVWAVNATGCRRGEIQRQGTGGDFPISVGPGGAGGFSGIISPSLQVYRATAAQFELGVYQDSGVALNVAALVRMFRIGGV